MSLVLTALIALTAFPFLSVAIKNETIEYFPDGSYGITEIVEYSDKAVTGTKTSSKNYKYYNSSNELLWKVTLTATFTYNGSTSSCTSASPGHTVYNSNWKVKTATASYSGNTATGNYTVKRYALLVPVETVNKTLTLKCDKNGNVS